jgi:hypothetical protein
MTAVARNMRSIMIALAATGFLVGLSVAKSAAQIPHPAYTFHYEKVIVLACGYFMGVSATCSGEISSGLTAFDIRSITCLLKNNNQSYSPPQQAGYGRITTDSGQVAVVNPITRVDPQSWNGWEGLTQIFDQKVSLSGHRLDLAFYDWNIASKYEGTCRVLGTSSALISRN